MKLDITKIVEMKCLEFSLILQWIFLATQQMYAIEFCQNGIYQKEVSES